MQVRRFVPQDILVGLSRAMRPSAGAAHTCKNSAAFEFMIELPTTSQAKVWFVSS